MITDLIITLILSFVCVGGVGAVALFILLICFSIAERIFYNNNEKHKD